MVEGVVDVGSGPTLVDTASRMALLRVRLMRYDQFCQKIIESKRIRRASDKKLLLEDSKCVIAPYAQDLVGMLNRLVWLQPPAYVWTDTIAKVDQRMKELEDFFQRISEEAACAFGEEFKVLEEVDLDRVASVLGGEELKEVELQRSMKLSKELTKRLVDWVDWDFVDKGQESHSKVEGPWVMLRWPGADQETESSVQEQEQEEEEVLFEILPANGEH